MARTSKHVAFLVAVLIFAPMILMGGQCNPNGPEPSVDLKPGAMTADFADGTSFVSANAKASDQGNEIEILATQDNPMDEFTIDIPKQATVPYTVTMPNPLDFTTLVEYCETVGASCRQFFAKQGQGTCSITITQLSPTVRGTFTATTIQRSPFVTDSVRVINSGAFNATYQ